ncbi:MAG: helix-turn-helix transcriptional regulator [Bacteroidaceae bacterium]|nr:helix-turn-helix transcriptional regulator [Bacteroidaceae bacterium]
MNDLKDEYREQYQQFGLNVVYYRKKKRYSQTQLAELVDIHRTYVSSIELGKVSVSFDVLFKLAEVLEIPPHKLFEFRE